MFTYNVDIINQNGFIYPMPQTSPTLSSPHTRHPGTWRRLLPALAIMPTIALVLSGLITWINTGLGPGFMLMWLKAFAHALPVLPIGLLIMEGMQRLVAPLSGKTADWILKCVLGLGTAVIMETLLSSAVTYSIHGLSTGFTAHWMQAFLGSLPLGLLIGLTMAFVIRPRLQRWMAAS